MSDALPNRLYKYRAPDIAKLVDILLLNQMWAASPLTFNDPFDCHPHVDFTGTDTEARAFMEKWYARQDIAVSETELHADATAIARDGLAARIDRESWQDRFREAVSLFGIISFAKCSENILMWSHYAENHTGVCLEFSMDVEPFDKAHQVHYEIERPVYRPLDPNQGDLMEHVLLHKAKFWEYEREWRCFRIGGEGFVKFDPKALTSIILGSAVKGQFVEKLNALNSARKVELTIKKASFDEKDFKLHIT